MIDEDSGNASGEEKLRTHYGLRRPLRVGEVKLAVTERRLARTTAVRSAPLPGGCTSRPGEGVASLGRDRVGSRLCARVPWVKCPDHGVRTVSVPWAEPHGSSRDRVGFGIGKEV